MQQFNVPLSEYIKVLQEKADRIRKNRAKIDPTVTNDGGWILENFPNGLLMKLVKSGKIKKSKIPGLFVKKTKYSKNCFPH
ncbi:hypothetical protein BpHYR1_048417 [Brachionus plicatilis]|uniref:Uncharacterized protein n=1 Tax=Brachionus plicatilis TaxID=10195 RepID=A0A3M7Q7E3_BRAPC|nr:hypothetical protein BpHYR1_048417 [Brachionus plicatilis]